MAGRSGKSGNPITDYNNHKKGKKGKLSVQEDLGIIETPAEQAKPEAEIAKDMVEANTSSNIQIPNWSDSFKQAVAEGVFTNGNIQPLNGISDAAIKKMYDPAIADLLIKERQRLEQNTILGDKATQEQRQTNSEKSSESKTLDDVWADSLGIPRSELNLAKPNTASQPAANPEKVTPERQAAQDMVETSKEMPKEEKPSKNKSIDDVWADVINEEWHKKYDVDWNNPEAVQNAKENAFRTNDYTSYRYLSDDQIRQLYPDPKEAEALINGKYESAKHKSNPDYDDNYLRYSLMDDVSTYPNYGFPVPVGEIVPPVRAKINKKETVQEPPVQEPSREPLKNNVTTWERPPMPSELPKKLKSNNPFLLIDPAEFKKTFGESSPNLNTPYGWSPYSYVRGRGISYNAAQPISTAQKIVAGLGLGALGTIYGLGPLVRDSQQTQPPYRMESEPVNEAVPQSELTPEQQFVLQSTSPFDYAKGANLFDLYNRYGSSASSDNSVNDEELIDEATGEFVSPQEPPPLGATLDSVDSPDTADIPEELNTPLLRNASWDLRKIADDATRLVPMPSRSHQRGARPPLKSGYELPSEAKPLTEQELAAQMAGYRIASKTGYVPQKINNKYQSSQKPEAALAQSLLKAQQESRANRGDTGLQQYRYQSLLNSGLRGMTPDEAIRSGLLTPEQVQVLMRGPY